MTAQEQALEIASAVTKLFERFELTGRLVVDPAPLTMETVRVFTTYEVYTTALRVLQGPPPSA